MLKLRPSKLFCILSLMIPACKTAERPRADEPVEGFIAEIPDAVRLRHEHHLKRIAQSPIEVAIFGDSIMRGWEDHESIWNEHFVPLKTALFTTTQDTTSNLLWRIENGEADGYRAKLCVVMIGTNNGKAYSAEETVTGIRAIVKCLHHKQPTARILVLGLFSGDRTFAKKLNALLKAEAASKSFDFNDHGDVLLEPDGTLSPVVSPDGTHLNEAGYRRWLPALINSIRTHLPSGKPTMP